MLLKKNIIFIYTLLTLLKYRCKMIETNLVTVNIKEVKQFSTVKSKGT